jgi:Ca2+-binding RTX toxin-like protein
MQRVALVLAGMALVLLLASGVALALNKIIGTKGSDLLIGTNGPDWLNGKGGNDRLIGREDRDNILGSRGNDVIRGGPGSDSPRGPGTWGLHGDIGADVIHGGPGDDLLTDGSTNHGDGVDRLGGGGGDDWLIASSSAPPSRDVLRCGAGRDRASVDREDEVRDDCERVDLFP